MVYIFPFPCINSFMKKALLFLVIFSSLLACKKDESLDPKLVGSWSDFNVTYTFSSDFRYNIKYLRTGKGPDTVTVDSVYGEYSLERSKKKNKVIFNQKGYREKFTGVIVSKEEYATTWNYSFPNDTALTYTSHTSLGTLYKE